MLWVGKGWWVHIKSLVWELLTMTIRPQVEISSGNYTQFLGPGGRTLLNLLLTVDRLQLGCEVEMKTCRCQSEDWSLDPSKMKEASSWYDQSHLYLISINWDLISVSTAKQNWGFSTAHCWLKVRVYGESNPSSISESRTMSKQVRKTLFKINSNLAF